MGNAHSQGTNTPPAECPMHMPPVAADAPAPKAHSQGTNTPPAECPMHMPPVAADAPAPKARGTVYNVYAQPIDPKNQMPATANQLPSEGQHAPLPTERVQSSIRKGGTESTWLYPSPQMFWNALVRKNKAHNVDETNMEVVVKIHNEMNERAWRKLSEWEELHAGEHLPGEPSLRRFMGRPYDFSLKAKVKALLGFGTPFDRHDWYVDRGGQEVRYIIDYYYAPGPDADVAGAGTPDLRPHYTKSIHVDVRPALDTAGSALDRLRRFPARAIESLQRPWFKAEGINPDNAPQEAAAFALSSASGHGGAEAPAGAPTAAAAGGSSSAAAAAASSGPHKMAQEVVGGGGDELLDAIQRKCGPLLEQLKAAAAAGEGEDKRRERHIKFNYCMGSVLCPAEASAFLDSLTVADAAAPDAALTNAAREEAAFLDMTNCVSKRMHERREASAPASAPPLR